MKKLAICLLLSLTFSTPVLAEECTSKLQGFVNKIVYKIKPVQFCKLWAATDALNIPRGKGSTGLLLIGDGGEMGVIGTVLQSKANLTLSPNLLLKLMQLNNELDFMKVGIDRDGDLFVRAEIHMSTLTAEEFMETVKDVALASNQIYALLKK